MAMDKEKLARIYAMRQSQVVSHTFGSTDPKFPLFKTPVNENLLVYIPALNVTKLEDGTEYNDLLKVSLHNWRIGERQFGQIACISGIDDDDPMAQELGYSGHTCPACEAYSECWDLVNARTVAYAKELGIDPQQDKDDRLKNVRQEAMAKMALSRSSEYVTFPIVVIPHKNLRPEPDAEKKLQVYFVTMGLQRYQEKVCAGLSSLFDNPGHIAGRFMTWSYVYDTKGAQPNARDAARNASFNIIADAAGVQMLEKFKVPAEEAAKEFTNLKALEVLTTLEVKEYNALLSETNKIMKETRAVLAAQNGVNGSAALPASPEKVLESFGATAIADVATGVGDMGVTPAASDTAEHRFG